MKKDAQKLVAEAAARFMVDGLESEYLAAKERAVSMLGLGPQTRLPSNRKIREWVGILTRDQLGGSEVERRLKQMRLLAVEIMTALADFDPYLIGSTLSGEIHQMSDLDFHTYSDDYEEVEARLQEWDFEEIEVDLVQNRKGEFVHLRWLEQSLAPEVPVEVTVYPWNDRQIVPFSSVTGKPMKRADLAQLRHLLAAQSESIR